MKYKAFDHHLSEQEVATSSSFEFFNYSVDGVSGHTAKVIIFSNAGSTSDIPEELAFDITSDKLTLAHDYLVARPILNHMSPHKPIPDLYD